MPANLRHLAINADDLDASRAFYEAVLGWTFTPWGPPGFFHITTGTDDDPGIQCALQERRTFDGTAPQGVEATFAVDDVAATRAAVLAAGGTILMEPFTITGVGHLLWFRDPAGTPVGAMQYDDAAE